MDLDDLMAEAIQEKGQRKAVKAIAQKRGMGRQLTAAEGSVLWFEAEKRWEEAAEYAVWRKITCSCGSERMFFSRFVREYEHAHWANSRRWVTIKKSDLSAKLERGDMYEVERVELCPICASDYVFIPEEAVLSPFSVSKAEKSPDEVEFDVEGEDNDR